MIECQFVFGDMQINRNVAKKLGRKKWRQRKPAGRGVGPVVTDQHSFHHQNMILQILRRKSQNDFSQFTLTQKDDLAAAKHICSSELVLSLLGVHLLAWGFTFVYKVVVGLGDNCLCIVKVVILDEANTKVGSLRQLHVPKTETLLAKLR